MNDIDAAVEAFRDYAAACQGNDAAAAHKAQRRLLTYGFCIRRRKRSKLGAVGFSAIELERCEPSHGAQLVPLGTLAKKIDVTPQALRWAIENGPVPHFRRGESVLFDLDSAALVISKLCMEDERFRMGLTSREYRKKHPKLSEGSRND